jgi:uncharacterized protein YbjQ (UPF0145 family)
MKTEKYDLKLTNGSWLNNLSEDEIADQIRSGGATAQSDCNISGSNRISTVRRLITNIESLASAEMSEQRKDRVERRRNIFLTTEFHLPDYEIVGRQGIITAECAFGMNILKDLFVNVRDVFGGRSRTTQKILRESRNAILEELKEEALEIGANAVIGVSLSYSEFGGGGSLVFLPNNGKSMLFVVATGTAVTIKKKGDAN